MDDKSRGEAGTPAVVQVNSLWGMYSDAGSKPLTSRDALLPCCVAMRHETNPGLRLARFQGQSPLPWRIKITLGNALILPACALPGTGTLPAHAKYGVRRACTASNSASARGLGGATLHVYRTVVIRGGGSDCIESQSVLPLSCRQASQTMLDFSLLPSSFFLFKDEQVRPHSITFLHRLFLCFSPPSPAARGLHEAFDKRGSLC